MKYEKAEGTLNRNLFLSQHPLFFTISVFFFKYFPLKLNPIYSIYSIELVQRQNTDPTKLEKAKVTRDIEAKNAAHATENMTDSLIRYERQRVRDTKVFSFFQMHF